jgi:hypothetical protein
LGGGARCSASKRAEVEREPISWLEAEPGRVEVEKEVMADRAPQMVWFEGLGRGLGRGGFEGLAPLWPMPRRRPSGLERLTGGAQLRLRVEYRQGFPAQPPRLVPLSPAPGVERRMQERFHVNGDGSICLILHPSDWSSDNHAADLVEKASGWFVEYLAVECGLIQEMSREGIFNDDYLDARLGKL